VDVTIIPELQEIIEAEIRAGHYGSADEFLNAAARHYIIAREFGEAYSREEIEAKIRLGIEQLDKGEGIEGDEAFRQIRERLAERRRKRA
jgi:antitoxin ParD1/3/4